MPTFYFLVLVVRDIRFVDQLKRGKLLGLYTVPNQAQIQV